MEPKSLAERIVNVIIGDFTDRRGLRQEWEEIDDEIRAEIEAEWVRLVEGVLSREK